MKGFKTEKKAHNGSWKINRLNEVNPHHHLHEHQQLQSTPITGKINGYSPYNYQHQRQLAEEQFIGNRDHQSAFSVPTEVLDLSRRCGSVESPRKTPSPFQTNSSFGTGSPVASPTHSAQEHTQTPISIIPANLFYSTQAHRPQLPPGFASFYPAFYYPGNLKQESNSLTSPPQIAGEEQFSVKSPAPAPAPTQTQLPAAATNSLLQSFANAAANSKVDAPEQHSPVSIRKTIANKSSVVMTSTSSAASTADVKPTRPFKTFPRDPLVIAANFTATDVLLDNPRAELYSEYRKRALEQIRNSNGGSRTITNPKMRRTNSRNGSAHEGLANNSDSEERNIAEESSDCESNAGHFEKTTSCNSSENSLCNSSSGSQVKDAAYYERRRKNNAAAKKSRDRRRIKEDEIAIRAAYLERQNIELLCQIDALKSQLAAFTSKFGA